MRQGRISHSILGCGLTIWLLAASAAPAMAAIGEGVTLTGRAEQKRAAVGQTVTFVFTATNHAAGLRRLDEDPWSMTNLDVRTTTTCTASDGHSVSPDGGNCEWGGLTPGVTYTATISATVTGGRQASIEECLYNYAVAHRSICTTASVPVAG